MPVGLSDLAVSEKPAKVCEWAEKPWRRTLTGTCGNPAARRIARQASLRRKRGWPGFVTGTVKCKKRQCGGSASLRETSQ